MYELHYLAKVVTDLLVGAFLLRWLFAWQRVDFRNPLVYSLQRFTNPLVLPLRRVLPAIGRSDTASIAALLLVALGRVLVLGAISGFGGAGAVPDAVLLLLGVAYFLLRMTLDIVWFAVLLSALLSWVGHAAPAQLWALARLADPLLRPLQRLLPTFGGLDLSPLVALILLQLVNGSLALHFGAYFGAFDL